MGDRPDITIPEEARRASEAAALAARLASEGFQSIANAAVEAAAPLIVAAELERIADRIQPDGADPDADEREDGYDEATDDIGAALRVRAAELRGATCG